MGLITTLLTLPLAPVRGTVWLAQIIQAEVESRELDEPSILAALQELEVAREAGDFSEEEIEQAEDALVEQLMALRGVGGQESYGQFG
ncbi:MAG TPA: gas vesicle protein GvpG [Solirubrobacteraceae bacterium]|nr:gas vesicle protein GvpG [Solirubrobacteraceae bacterium]